MCMYVCVLFECYAYGHGHGCLVYTTLLWCTSWIGNCVQWLPCQLSGGGAPEDVRACMCSKQHIVSCVHEDMLHFAAIRK